MMSKVKEFLLKVVAAEPVAIVGFLSSVSAVVVGTLGLISPEMAAAIIAMIVATHTLMRAMVFAPDTVAGLPNVDVVLHGVEAGMPEPGVDTVEGPGG